MTNEDFRQIILQIQRDERRKLTWAERAGIKLQIKQHEKKKIQEAKEWMERPLNLNKKIALKNNNITFFTEQAERCVSNPSECLMTGNCDSRVETYSIKIVEEQKEILRLIKEAKALQHEILQKINKLLYPEYRTLLNDRYIKNKDWSEISNILRMDESHVRTRLHDESLKTIHYIIFDKNT